ncbi:hypothetical protein L1987_76678 [Smallanthus sonchifolius]|uniref:Uncharacterized protein n=1 Tax=Smallanthus sonchifolius TaxID=185202 RepID=A0ACB8Z7N5_9ASTR|nr:hypothetical protein L1987_76678 [Smallanthus sonchifolius]
MGKKSTNSWLTAVKRAFTPHKSTKIQHEDNILQKKDQKMRSRSWLFRKSSTTNVQQQITQVRVKTSSNDTPQPVENHAILMAEATVKAAEAAATTAHAAAEIIRLTTRPSISVNHHFAAIRIQTSFRGYLSRDGTCVPDDWSDRPHNLEELDAILHNRKVSNRNLSAMDENELEETASWLDQWIRAKQWEKQRTSRASFDRKDSIKTIEIDSSRPSSRSGTGGHKLPHNASHYIPNSPSRRSSYSPSTGQQPFTPSPIKTVPLQMRSASPRCLKEERSYLNANIQSLRLTPRAMGSMCRYSTCANDMTVPNYMAATESAKARIRSQSTPRQRPSTPERERVGSVKKKLAYPVLDPCHNGCDNYNIPCCEYGYNLRSPSFKSVQVGHVGMGQQWYYADSTTGGEISPCSTTDLRRWLR